MVRRRWPTIGSLCYTRGRVHDEEGSGDVSRANHLETVKATEDPDQYFERCRAEVGVEHLPAGLDGVLSGAPTAAPTVDEAREKASTSHTMSCDILESVSTAAALTALDWGLCG